MNLVSGFVGRQLLGQAHLPTKAECHGLSILGLWWHDGWWEGIVVKKTSEDSLHVYIPGEKQEAIFNLGDLRHSLEWLGSVSKHIKERPELVTSILSPLEVEQNMLNLCDDKLDQGAVSDNK